MMNEKLTPEQRKRFFLEINKKSDTIIEYALLIYFVFGIFLAIFYSTFIIALGVGGLCLTAYFITKKSLPGNNLYQYVASAVFAVFTAQFIYQMHGLFEMHFFVFVSTTLLITYQNWKLQIPLLLLVVIHHSTFAYLQYTGNTGIYFTQLQYMDLQAFLFHAGLAAVISAICGYWSYDLEKGTEASALKTVILEAQLANVNNNIAFADEISKGNLSVDYALLEESDILGKSLIAMRKNLVAAAEREQEEKFVTIGITKVGEIIQKNNADVQKLADDFLICIVRYLGINQGGVFLHGESMGEQSLNLVSSYAYDRKKFQSRKINIGEGLVGQCFLEKEMFYMNDVPLDYIHIGSGLGDARPTNILIMPLMTNDAIVGVMELASFKQFTAGQISLVKKVAENIASSVVASGITEHVKKLLGESQEQAEQMKSQEEEMRQNMEELQATQEEMNRKVSEFEELLNLRQNEILSLKSRLVKVGQLVT